MSVCQLREWGWDAVDVVEKRMICSCYRLIGMLILETTCAALWKMDDVEREWMGRLTSGRKIIQH